MYSVCLVKTVRRGTSDRSNAATDATFFLVVLPSTSSIPSRIDATRVFLPKLSYRAANLDEKMQAYPSSFSFLRFFFSPGSHKWQKGHSKPLPQPFVWTKAHGLQRPRP